MDLGECLFEGEDLLGDLYPSSLYMGLLLDISEQWIQAKDVTTDLNILPEVNSFHEGGKVGWLDVFDLEALFP